MKRLNELALNAVTLASNAQSITLNIAEIYTLSIVSTATGTVAGTVKVQVSNDFGQNEQGLGVSNWADLSAGRTLSVAGSFADSFDAVGYKWARVTFTANSGTGTLSVALNGKGA